jgi:hypothetical protein
MLMWTTAGLTRLATLMKARESSAGEASWGLSVSDFITFAVSGSSWPKTNAWLDANKPNPSERASAGVNLRARFALLVDPLNFFSIFVFYL